MARYQRAFILIPMNLIRTARKLTRQYLLYLKYREILMCNKKLKNTKNKRCFIIGTGPSIKDQDLLRLKNEYTFVVNTFWNHPQYQAIDPAYYILTDPEVFPNNRDRGDFWQKEILEKTSVIETCPRTELFLNISGKEFVEKNNLFREHAIHYLALSGHFRDNLNFNTDIDRVIPTTKNVIVAAIIIATYMGFDELYLLGCEHSFLAQPAQDYYRKFQEFYKTNYDEKNPEQIKRYAMDIMTYEGHIDNIKILFKNYRLLKQKLAKEKPAVKIYNATPNSYLDVFPYIKFENIKL